MSTISLFSKEGSNIVGSLIELVDSSNQFSVSAVEEDERTPVVSTPSDSDSLYCTSCKVTLQDRQDQLLHYRLDWHRVNLKRKVQGKQPLSAEAFEEITSDISSISGSDSETSDNELTSSQPRCSHFITFTGSHDQQQYMIYRTVLFNTKHVPSVKEEVMGLITGLTQPQVWVILMRSAGHFAGAVFKGASVVVHKTFHRYTVRAKRGTIQSSKDSQQGHQPKSAGASIRRHNEAALEQEIQDLVTKWSPHIEESSAIFIRIPAYNQATFFGGKKPLFSKGDVRLRTLPFLVRRPTFSEVKRVHTKLATLYHPVPVAEKLEASTGVSSHSNKSGKTETAANTSTPAVASEPKSDLCREENILKPEEDIDFPDTKIDLQLDSSQRKDRDESKTSDDAIIRLDSTESPPPPVKDVSPPSLQEELQITCTRGDLKHLSKLLSQFQLLYPVDGITEGSPGDNSNDDTPASLLSDSQLLHIASSQGHWRLVMLLLTYGADPAVKDQHGKLSYNLARDKKTRESFRKFMGYHPGVYDYAKAQVPSPLTDDMESARKDKLNEKKKAQKRAKKTKEVEQKAEEKQQEAVNNLSLREKCVIAAEKRILSNSPGSSLLSKSSCCSNCEKSLAGIVPFEKYDHKYCTMNCVREHRKKLEQT